MAIVRVRYRHILQGNTTAMKKSKLYNIEHGGKDYYNKQKQTSY